MEHTVDDAVWAMEPGARHLLHQAGLAVVLLILITPYAIQSSAILTENLAAPLFTMGTMKVITDTMITDTANTDTANITSTTILGKTT